MEVPGIEPATSWSVVRHANHEVVGALKHRLLNFFRPIGKNNIEIDIKIMGLDVGNWVYSAQDRDNWRSLLNSALNLRVS